MRGLVLSVVFGVLLFDESSARRGACVRLEQGCCCSALRAVLRIVSMVCCRFVREREHVFANNDFFRLVSLRRVPFFTHVFVVVTVHSLMFAHRTLRRDYVCRTVNCEQTPASA